MKSAGLVRALVWLAWSAAASPAAVPGPPSSVDVRVAGDDLLSVDVGAPAASGGDVSSITHFDVHASNQSGAFLDLSSFAGIT